MIADLQPYPEYKESGVSWLGDIPMHWEVRRLSSVAQFNSGKAHEQFIDETGKHICVTARFVSTDGAARKFCTRNFSPAQRGDVLMVMSDLPNGRALARAFLVNDDASYAVNQRVCIIRPLKMLPPLLAYQANRNWGLLQNDDRCNQTHLSNRDYKTLPLLNPPLDEQAAIVRFLDWANGRLERAIRAKRKVIALLNEQKQAIIHRAVTRGLDPSVPLKPSGIPWLGDIPKHWEVRRLKSLCRFVTSGSRGWARYYADDGFVFLRIGNISTTSVDLRLKRISYVTPPPGAEGERTRARPNDLLLSITAQIGAVGVVPDGLGEAYVNQHTALIRLRPEGSVPRWVAYGLLSQFGKDQCRLMTNGGTKVGLTLDDVRCLYVLLPPMHDQVRLVAGIETETRALDSAISRLEREIELLREYRTRLVADVVTGKLDVREMASKLPEEAADLDPSEDADTLAEGEENEESEGLDAVAQEAEA